MTLRFSHGMPAREGWTEIGSGVSVPNAALTEPPYIQWNHIDGPLMHWAGQLHWLTWRERFAIWFGRSTAEQIAQRRWPHLAQLRQRLEPSP